MNASLLEIAKILLEHEVSRIENQKAAAPSQVVEAQEEATADNQAKQLTRPGHYAPRRRAGQTQEVTK